MRFYFLVLGTILLVAVGCQMDGTFTGQQAVDRNEFVAPPAAMLAHPGPMVDLPRPALMASMAPQAPRSFQSQSTQVRFANPAGMGIGWQVGPGFAENQLTSPARYNFSQGATYRLKLGDVPGREGMIVYPTLQVYPTHPTTDAYLSHNSVPLEITDEDLDQVSSNNFVTKVIFLPDPKFQELAIAGVETLVSTKLEPGADPVSEAERRGTIMLVLRMGNMDHEMANAPMGPGAVEQVSYWQLDGDQEQYAPPTPIAVQGNQSIPGPMMMGMPGGPGMPGVNPVSGVAGTPVWGMPSTATPIGLPGPPHLPFGRPAGLKSHTVRNLSENIIPRPTDHLLIDVKHDPGIRMPEPVRHIQYNEKHPIFSPGQTSWPKNALPGQPY
jgi:hypothetical protein